MRRGSNSPHKQPGSPAPARRNPLNSPPPVFPYTRSSAARAPLGNPGSLTAGHEGRPQPHSLASWVGQTASHPPSAPGPLRCGCPRPLPPPVPGGARRGRRGSGCPRGGPTARHAHTAPLRGGPAPAGLNPSPASGVPVARSAKPHRSGAGEAAHNRAVLSVGKRGGRRARSRRYSLTAAASECIFVQRCTRCRPGPAPALLPIQSLGTDTSAPPTARAHWSWLPGDAASPAFLLGEAPATLPPPARHNLPGLSLGRRPSRPRLSPL